MIVEDPQLGVAPARSARAGAVTDSGAAPASSGGAPIRVAFCIDNLAAIGGTELNAVRTAEAFDPADVRVTLVSLQPDGPMRARYETAGIPVVHASPGGSLLHLGVRRRMRDLARYFREARIDVVHCHDKYSNVFAGLAGRTAGTPRVITSKRWWKSPLRHEVLNGIAFRAADRVLVNSAAIQTTLRGVEWVRKGRVVVVPNFVDDDAFAPLSAAEVRDRRARIGVPADAPLVGCVARLERLKDHAGVIRAFARVADAYPEWHLVLIGEGEERAALVALAASLRLGARVHLPGSMPPTERPHALFEFSVLGSWHEGFPNSVVEAFAAGRPVVATAVGGVPELVNDMDTGRLVPVRDVTAMAQALDAMMRDRDALRAQGGRARALARERFHRDRVIGTLVGLYRGLTAPVAAGMGLG